MGKFRDETCNIYVEVHHIVPKKLSELLKSDGKLPNNFDLDLVPGHAYTKEIHRALHNGPDGLNSLLQSSSFGLLSPEAKMAAVVAKYRDKGFGSLADVCDAWLTKNVSP